MQNSDIEIMQVNFDRFVFDSNYKWGLAFYKLCCLSHLAEGNWDNICYTDSNIFFQASLDNVWAECRDNILLYDINHGIQVNDYRILCDEIKDFYGMDEMPLFMHYGGELFAANRENARPFICNAQKVYKDMIEKQTFTTKCDEFIITICAGDVTE